MNSFGSLTAFAPGLDLGEGKGVSPFTVGPGGAAGGGGGGGDGGGGGGAPGAIVEGLLAGDVGEKGAGCI